MTYKSGDIVRVELDKDDALILNAGCDMIALGTNQILPEVSEPDTTDGSYNEPIAHSAEAESASLNCVANKQERKAMSELKPCPFDGGKAEVDCHPGEGDWCVTCSTCHVVHDCFGSKEAAITAWNTRTPSDSLLCREMAQSDTDSAQAGVECDCPYHVEARQRAVEARIRRRLPSAPFDGFAYKPPRYDECTGPTQKQQPQDGVGSETERTISCLQESVAELVEALANLLEDVGRAAIPSPTFNEPKTSMATYAIAANDILRRYIALSMQAKAALAKYKGEQ